MTTTIAINNLKGGVAKTTSCISLGACLAEMGHSVLLIDMDPQGHLTLSTGVQPEKLHRTVRDALLHKNSLVSVSRETSVLGLDIVPANSSLAVIDKLLYGQDNYEYRLKNALTMMNSDLYDYVLIDCPPAFGIPTLNALTAADMLIIPVQCEYYAAYALRQVTGLVNLVKRKTNPDLGYRVLVTMYDRRNKICRLIYDQIQGDLNKVLFNTIIEVDTKLREAPAFGKPITQYAPKTRGAEQYCALAEELVNNGR